MPDYLPPVVARLTGDDSQLTRTLNESRQRAERWARDMSRIRADITVVARMDTASQRRVETVRRELSRDVSSRVRVGMDDAAQRRAEAQLARLSRDRTAVIRTRVVGGGTPAGAGGAGGDVGAMSTLISLAPALTPIAAVAANVALSLTAGTVAVGAFGLAVKSQISGIGQAADAQAKYNAAVAKYGAYSKQAQAAQEASARSLDGMPVATQRATEGWLHLKDTFKAWSDSQAKFTMEPVLHSFAVAEQILPRLSPMVKGTSQELDRLITVAGGGVSSPGFDAFADRVSAFANNTLHNATNDIIHFSRVLTEGKADGPVSKFLAYAKQEGPQVKQTMADIARAVETLLKASSEAGPGMLTLVDDVAKLVAALPPSFVGRAMEVYTAFKLYKLANSGITSVGGSLTNLSGQLTTLRAAAVNAGGGLAGTRAAIASISTGTKVAGAVAVVAGLALVFKHFSDESKKAKVSSDDMSTALKGLAAGGTATATIEQLTKDAGNLHQSLTQRLVSNDSVWDIVRNSGSKTSSAKKDFEELGTALADMVKAGESDQAAKALKKITDAGVKVPTKNLKDYKSALADAAFESKMTADSMGLFGDQAVQVQKKLDAQKKSAQGLQQAILDLNDANRAAMDAQSNYAQSVADATAGIKKHEHALKMSNGELVFNSQASREAYQNLSTMAANAEAASVAIYQQTGSQDKANRVLIDAHKHLMDTAHATGLNTDEARRLADQLDNIHDPKIQITVLKDAALANVNAAKAALNSIPKNPKSRLSVDARQALNVLRDAQAVYDRLVSKTITIRSTYVSGVGNVFHEGGAATGAIVTGGVRRMAEGGFGRPAMMAKGGSNILWGEGPDESYIPHTRNARSRRIASETVGILGGHVSWDGGASTAGGNVADGVARGIAGGRPDVMAAAVAMAKAATAAFSAELGIASPSKKFRALGAYTMSGLVQGLTGSTASVKSATKRLASMLYTDFGSGHKAFQQAIGRDNALLLRLASQRDTVASKLKTAQSNLAALNKSWVAERNSIASGIMQNASIITASPDPGRGVNASDVVAQMRQRVQAATQFAAQLEQLRKKGLRTDLIQQLAAAGVDQAGSTVLALAGGSSGQIAEMNRLQSNLSSAANATGAAVANSMYAAGIKSAQGLVKGLQSQEKAIDAQMLRIALSMQKAIKRALGIRSPSTVMAELGDYTARGMAVGIQRSSKHVVVAARGMAMSVRQGAVLGGGGEGGTTVVHHHHYEFNIAGNVATVKGLANDIEREFLKLGARNPMTYQPFKR